MKPDRPIYRVPSMSEIRALPWNSFNVVSTFSGCGGSCLGFKMAGYRVLWANEFIPAAQETYRANHPEVYLDTRDIRTVTAASIREIIGDTEIDVLEGSPPCASFSTAGHRERTWGRIKQYSDTQQRVDDLFFEYTRLVRDLQPRAFVAENVSGLVKGTAKGYFLEILSTLKACGYRVACRVLDAQWLGVPQMRARTIFVGVRNDLNREPIHPTPLPYRYSVRDALPWIVQHEYMGPGHQPAFASADVPAYTISQLGNFSKKLSPFTLVEAETDIQRFAIGKEWDKLRPGEQSDKYFQLVKPDLNLPSPTITCPPDAQFSKTACSGSASVVHPTEKRKFSIAELKRICAFPDDFVLTGTFAQQWERLGRAVPPLMMRAVAETIRDHILGAQAA